MADLALFMGEWPLRSALAGGALLLTAAVAMRFIRQPAKRQRLGELALLGALVVAVLCALPGWLPFSMALPILPRPAAAAPDQQKVEPPPTNERLFTVGRWVESAESENAAGIEAVPVQGIAFAPADQAIEVNGSIAKQETAAPVAYPWNGFPWWKWLVVGGSIYFALLCWSLIRCVIGYVGLSRWRRNGDAAPTHAALLLTELTKGWRRPPQLRVSRHVPLPVSFGLFRPTILIPPMFARGGAKVQLRWILVHELTHLERRDAWSCLLLALSQAVYFFVPWFWWLRRQVRLCQEYVADAAVAVAGLAHSADYAQYLVSLSMLASRRSAIGVQASGVLGNTSDLYRRIAMLLNEQAPVERTCPRGWSLTAGIGVLAVAVALSGVGLRASAAEVESRERIIVVGDDEGKRKIIAFDDEEQPEKIMRRLMECLPAEECKRVMVWLADETPRNDTLKFREKREVEREAIRVLVDGKPGEKYAQAAEEYYKAKAAPAVNELTELEKSIAKMQEQLKKLKDLKPEQRAVVQKALEMAQRELADARKAAEAAKSKETLQYHYMAKELLKDAGAGIGDVPRLGVRVEAPPIAMLKQLDMEPGKGLIIGMVLPDGPGAKAGLKPCDFMLEFAGKPLSDNPKDFLKLVQGIKGDDDVEIIIIRKGQKVPLKGIKLPEAKGEWHYKLIDPKELKQLDLKDLKFTIPLEPGKGPADKPKPPFEGQFEYELKKSEDGKYYYYELKGTPKGKVEEIPLDKLKLKPDGKFEFEIEIKPSPAKPAKPVDPPSPPKVAPAPGTKVVPGKPIPELIAPKAKDSDLSGTTVKLTKNGGFDLKHQDDGVEIHLAGTVGKGKAKLSLIEINDGKKSAKYDSIDDVPGPRWEKVKSLIKIIEKASDSVESKE